MPLGRIWAPARTWKLVIGGKFESGRAQETEGSVRLKVGACRRNRDEKRVLENTACRKRELAKPTADDAALGKFLNGEC